MPCRQKAAWQRGVTTIGRCGCAALIAFFASVLVSPAAPDIESISPLALRPRATTEVTFAGSGLDGATNIWANFAANFEALGAGHFRVTPLNNADGIGALRVYGSNGVSPLSFVMVDDLPTTAESKTNKTREAAQPVRFGSAVDGRSEELGYDWFRLGLNKGQRVAIEVVATRLGSRLDSVLRVFDRDGRQLAQNDDAPGLRGDSFITFAAPGSGDYFIELRDVNYSGGSEYFYHLRVGDFALATTTFPAAVEQGTKQSVFLAGPSGEVGRVDTMAATNSAAMMLSVKGNRGSSYARALASHQREITEREPNDTPANATRIELTDGMNGQFNKADDRDFFEFTARKGKRLEFRAATRSLGAPCDAMLEIQASNGKSLARSNPEAADEGIVSYKFASNGVYRLLVEEAAGAFGPNCVYHITSQDAAGFELALDNDRFNAAPGKSFDLKVNIARGEYKGVVKLGVEGLDSLLCTNNIIAEKKTNTTMKVTLPESLAPGTLHLFRIVGTATRDGTEVKAQASTAPALRRRFPQMLYVPAEFDGDVALGVIAPGE